MEPEDANVHCTAKVMCLCIGALKLVAVSLAKRKIALRRYRYMQASQIRTMQSNSPGENIQIAKNLKNRPWKLISHCRGINCYLFS